MEGNLPEIYTLHVLSPEGNAPEINTSHDLSAEEKKEMLEISEFVENNIEELKKLTKEFKRKGFWGLLWDSKVAENRKWFLHFFSLRRSNPDEVIKEISAYLTVYEGEMKPTLLEAFNVANSELDDVKKLCKDISSLKEKLKERKTKAEELKQSTTSSAAYRQHVKFISDFKSLESMVKSAELIVKNRTVQKLDVVVEELKGDLAESKARVDFYKTKSKEYWETLNKLTDDNKERLRNLQKKMEEKMEKKQKQLEDKSNEKQKEMEEKQKGMEKKLKEMEEKLKETTESQERLEETNKKLMKLLLENRSAETNGKENEGKPEHSEGSEGSE